MKFLLSLFAPKFNAISVIFLLLSVVTEDTLRLTLALAAGICSAINPKP